MVLLLLLLPLLSLILLLVVGGRGFASAATAADEYLESAGDIVGTTAAGISSTATATPSTVWAATVVAHLMLLCVPIAFEFKREASLFLSVFFFFLFESPFRF